MFTCSIIDYEDKHQQAFKALNAEWLIKFNLMESHDVEVLDHPRESIIDRGGVIYLAEHNGEIIGSAALALEHDDVYELCKMSVAPDYRKQGISKLLIGKCIAKARELKASKVSLFSNHQLAAALKLYEKYGFKYVPVENSPFTTADIKMELVL